MATTTANPIAAFNTCNSGVNCWKTDLDNTYNATSNQDLLSPNINLAGLSAPVVVTWAQRHQVETANFDRMFVDYQQVGGATPVRLYEWIEPTPISASAGTGNPQANIGGTAGWGVFSRRADSLAGLNTELRFHLESDSSVQFAGLAIDDVTVTACRALVADLSITKTDGVATAVPGGSVTYTMTASNAGPDPVTGATVADTFPATLTCTWTCVGAGGGTCTAAGAGNINDSVNLPVGGSVTYTASCTISASATGTLSNTATASSVISDPTPANNSATDVNALTPQADLAITKTDGVTTVSPGGSTIYTITASNPGPSNAPGSTVADTFPAFCTSVNWTCSGAGGGTCTAAGAGNINDTTNLPAGGSVTYSATCNISGAATGSLVNTATVATAGSVTDPTPGNNSATDTDTISQQADLSVTKTDGMTTATPGGSVTYTIVAANAGPSPDPAAIVADTFSTELTCSWTCAGAGGGTCTAAGAGNINDTVNLPSGGSVTYTANCTIDPAATILLFNSATVTNSSGILDPNLANNFDSDQDGLAPQADLSITKSDGLTNASPGDAITYTIVATNAGPSNAPGSIVTDTFPAALSGVTWTCAGAGGGTCTAAGAGNISDTADLPAGGSVAYTVNGTISGVFTGTLTNTAAVAAPADVTDPNTANNSATDTTQVASPAAITGTKEVAGDFSIGGTITYTITLSNNGASNQLDNPGDELTDVLPSTLALVSATSSTGTAVANLGTNTVTWNGSIAVAGSVTITIVATINPEAAGVAISNQGTISFDGDGNGTNEATGVTDDPDSAASGDPTTFGVGGVVPAIPTLSAWSLMLMALALLGAAWFLVRRRRVRV